MTKVLVVVAVTKVVEAMAAEAVATEVVAVDLTKAVAEATTKVVAGEDLGAAGIATSGLELYQQFNLLSQLILSYYLLVRLFLSQHLAHEPN